MTIPNLLKSVTVDHKVDAAYFAFLDVETTTVTRVYEAMDTTVHGILVDFTVNSRNEEVIAGVELLKIPTDINDLLEDLNNLHFLRTVQKKAIIAAVEDYLEKKNNKH